MVEYKICPAVNNDELNSLFRVSWSNHQDEDFSDVINRSLVYVCAYKRTELIGFVNVAWDGGFHAFLLDTTVHPDFRRKGIGTELVKRAIDACKRKGVQWLHVDYEEYLKSFYRKCGFFPTKAGLYHFVDTS